MRYVARLEIVAAYDPPELMRGDLARDHEAEMRRLVTPAIEEVINTLAAPAFSNSARQARIIWNGPMGVFEFDAVSISPDMVGTPMYAADDHTFDDAAGPTNDIKVGLLVKYVSATKGWIDIAR